MILFFHGPDTFLSRRLVRQSKERFKRERDPQGYNIVTLDGKQEEAGKFFGAIATAPFLAAKKMVAIDNVLSNGDRELLERFKDWVKKDSDSAPVVAVFWQGDPIGKLKEAKELQGLLVKQKYARLCQPLLGGELISWIMTEAASRGGAINREAAEYLARHAGGDSWLLNSLLDQLTAYKKEAAIALADVQLFLDEKLDDSAFSMTDAIMAGNHKTAFKLLNEQRRLGQEEPKLFGIIIWQLRILLELADALERENNLTSEILAQKLKIHPFVAKKNLALARKYPLAKLQKMYQRLLDADIKTKTGAAPQELLTDLFAAAV